MIVEAFVVANMGPLPFISFVRTCWNVGAQVFSFWTNCRSLLDRGKRWPWWALLEVESPQFCVSCAGNVFIEGFSEGLIEGWVAVCVGEEGRRGKGVLSVHLKHFPFLVLLLLLPLLVLLPLLLLVLLQLVLVLLLAFFPSDSCPAISMRHYYFYIGYSGRRNNNVVVVVVSFPSPPFTSFYHPNPSISTIAVIIITVLIVTIIVTIIIAIIIMTVTPRERETPNPAQNVSGQGLQEPLLPSTGIYSMSIYIHLYTWYMPRSGRRFSAS